MTHYCQSSSRIRLAAVGLVAMMTLGPMAQVARAHIVPPEKLHPVAESYRRLSFHLNLNPVRWDAVQSEAATIADGWAAITPADGEAFSAEVAALLDQHLQPPTGDDAPGKAERKATAQQLFELATGAVVSQLDRRLASARENLEDYRVAAEHLEEARQLWAAFEHEIRATDPAAYEHLGRCWLELTQALGHPGFLGIGVIAPDQATFDKESAEVSEYLGGYLRDRPETTRSVRLAPIPSHSPSFDAGVAVPAKLPPGSNLNKQLPRPRQILNMATRGVDESETTLIALGDMAFDSHAIFGEPARSLGITCNTCHNKSITNPGFFIPGLSARPGGMDVSNSFFAPHANNGHFDPIDIPDL
ncbi:MAG: hypothetical protein AAF657_14460, partial [Acidobacteriota bacterium]